MRSSRSWRNERCAPNLAIRAINLRFPPVRILIGRICSPDSFSPAISSHTVLHSSSSRDWSSRILNISNIANDGLSISSKRFVAVARSIKRGSLINACRMLQASCSLLEKSAKSIWRFSTTRSIFFPTMSANSNSCQKARSPSLFSSRSLRIS